MSIEVTQEIFSELIKKPQLTEQLLTRPPFKFILDIVANVIKSTGYLEDEFSQEQLEAAGNDKTTKTAFLDKLITILDDGTLKSVKSAKIISGKDSEETNKMLQRLGKNAANFRSTSVHNKKSTTKKEDLTTDEGKHIKKVDNSKTTKIKTSKNAESKSSGKEEKKKNKSKNSKKEKETQKLSGKEKKPKKEKIVDDEASNEKEVVETSKNKKKDHHVLARADSMIAINGDIADNLNDNEILQDDGYHEPQDLLDNSIANNSVIVSNQVGSEFQESSKLVKPDESQTFARPMTGAPGGRPLTSMGRPGTATSRPAPPKLKKKQIATVDSTPQSNIELKSKIIIEQDATNVTEEGVFVLENDEEKHSMLNETSVVEEEDQGILVQKIIETKNEIEDGAYDQIDNFENDQNTSAEREKVKALQEKLQDLTRSAFPLARLFDFANDDIESMIKELERWRSEQRRQEQDVQNKKAAGFGDNTRLFNIISGLQKEISDHKEELSKIRGRVLKNEKRIQHFILNF